MSADRAIRVEQLALTDRGALVGLITLDRPDQLNAIDWSMLEALDAAISELESTPDLAAILITGAGRAFSAGGDLKAYRELQRDATRFPQFVRYLHATFGRLRTLRVPVIALVNGVAVAGGLELLLNCDIALMARSARIADGHLNFGQMGGGGVLTLLPRLIGIARASELVLSGRFLTAEEALDWGLVSRVVADEELVDAGLELVSHIAAKSPLAVANAKFVMNSIWLDALPVAAGLRLENERNSVYCLTSEDAPEGLAAFEAKRDPKFTGR